MFEAIMNRIAREKHHITRSWSGDAYLTRWAILGRRSGGNWAVYVHKFHRSDADEAHNHPWPFVSLILSGGYWERTPDYRNGWKNGDGPMIERWYAPGRILVRPANWIHSVIIPTGQTATTLILRGKKQQSWGFFCPNQGYVPWREHEAKTAATGSGCG